MIIWITRKWEYLKAVAVILWPVRFVLLVMLVLVAVLSLPQGQDALYGAVVEGESRSRLIAAIIEGESRYWVMAAVIAWAVQTWYWSRFLLHLPLRAFPMRRYGGPPFDQAFARPWIAAIPRVLGALVFVIVGLFVWLSGRHSACHADQLCGPGWLAVFLLSGVVFIVLTVLRRRLLNRWRPVQPSIRPVSAATFRATTVFAAVWMGLLCVGAASAIWEFPPGLRQIASAAVVLALFLASLWMLFRLALPWGTTTFVALLTGSNMLLFLATIFYPAHGGIYFGPAFALLLNAGMWVGATSFFLVLPGERLRLPVTTLFIAGMVVFSAIPALIRLDAGDHDNHRVRSLGAAALRLGDDGGRADLGKAFAAWKQQAPCLDDPCTKRPMILVAAEGGASRSAYWVATVLGALQDASPHSPQQGAFHKSVFAISSVSGGSLGAAVFQRLIAKGSKGSPQLCGDSESYSICGQRVTKQDFLGGVFFSAFGPDLLQRLLPGNLFPDRAEALEHSWELSWSHIVGSDDFAQEFRLRRNLDGEWLPLLFLNGASVKTGRRIVTSDIALRPECKSSDTFPATPDLPSAVDFFCLTRQAIRLSTAVHNSARFPYVSPAGTLWARDDAGRSWKADEIVDGGYFEAQGATTLLDILTALRQPCGQIRHCADKSEEWTDEVAPILISIQNDPIDRQEGCADAPLGTPACQGSEVRRCADAPEGDVWCDGHKQSLALGDEAGTMGWMMRLANDLLAPPIGLAASRTGRGAYAARALEVRFYNTGWPALRFNLRGAEDVDKDVAPAMSWYLSKRSLRDMATDLCEPPDHNRPRREIDNSLDQLGAALNRPDLANAVRSGIGCQAIEKEIAPRR